MTPERIVSILLGFLLVGSVIHCMQAEKQLDEEQASWRQMYQDIRRNEHYKYTKCTDIDENFVICKKGL